MSDKIRDLHAPVEIEPSDTICGECSWQLPNGRWFGKVVEYPCPTLLALDDEPVPGRSEAEIKAEGAREALVAAAVDLQRDMDTTPGPRPLVGTLPAWLKARAARVAGTTEAGDE